MSTTALLVELVIIGFQALAWILVFIFLIFGAKWAHVSTLKEWAAPITILGVAISYSLGLVLDTLFRGLLKPVFWGLEEHATWTYGLSSGWWRGQMREALAELRDQSEWRQYVQYHNKDLADALDRRFNQIRLAGGTALNFLALEVLGLVYVLTRTDASWWTVAILGAAALLWVLGSLAAWIFNMRLYYWEAGMAVRVVREATKKAADFDAGGR
jgi:hypothetical protein